MNEPIEQEIQAKGLNAPRITPNDVESVVMYECYFTAADGVRAYGEGKPGENLLPEYLTYEGSPLSLLTFCVLVLRNGFTVTGESACASPENFDEQIGRKIARENALNKIWPLLGYELRSKLTRGVAAFVEACDKAIAERIVKTAIGLSCMTFGQALAALKDGKKVAREGWNGKGMWLSLSGPLGGRLIPHTAFWSKNNADYAAQQIEQEGHATVLPCITMKTATGEILMGWLASQTDMLAEDWLIVE